MKKIHKKLIGVSLSISTLFAMNIVANAMDVNENVENPQIVPVLAQSESSEKEESAETMSTLADIGMSVAEKTAETVVDEINDKKTEHKEKADEMKEKFNEMLDGMNENLEDLTKKQEEAQEQAKEDAEKMNEIKDKEKEIDEMKNKMEIQKKITQTVDEFNKSQGEAVDNLKNQIENVVAQDTEKNETNEKK